MAQLGRIPSAGDTVEFDGVRLTVARVEGRRIARVRLTPPEPAAGAGTDVGVADPRAVDAAQAR
jgi:putative hemolysin